jgi:uncharacterized protein (TIGR03435 family)
MRSLPVILLVAALPLSGPALAQAPTATTPRFEAASVKRNTTADFVLGTPRFQGETFTARQVAVEMLISNAYGIASKELIDGPRWIFFATGTDRFDVVAKAAPGSSQQDMQAMLRHMLEDRFKLRLRREKREMPVYLLTKMDPGGNLGPNLRPARDCAPKCEGVAGNGYARGQGADWARVLQNITNFVADRRVIDQSGLSGKFDFELTFRRVLSPDPNDSGVDIFTAVRQQFGLKLEPGRAPFEVGVIERVERPPPD